MQQQGPAVLTKPPRSERYPQSRARRRRRKTANRTLIWGCRLVVAAAALGLWQLLAGRVIQKFWISSPTDVWGALRALNGGGQLFPDIAVTAEETAIGLVFGILAGVIVGILLGLIEPLANILQPFIQALYAIPKIAIAPLFILWFGIDLKSKVILVIVVVFFLLFWSTYDGVRAVDKDLVNVVRLMGAKRFYIVTHVVLPSSMSSVFTGIKIAIPQALVAAVVGEMVASNRGVGYYIQFSSSQFDTAGVFGGIFILMILAIIIDLLANRLQSLIMRWNRA